MAIVSFVLMFLLGFVLALALVEAVTMWHERAERHRRVQVARRRFARPVLWPNLPGSRH